MVIGPYNLSLPHVVMRNVAGVICLRLASDERLFRRRRASLTAAVTRDKRPRTCVSEPCTTAPMQPYAGKGAILKVLCPNLSIGLRLGNVKKGHAKLALESEVVRP